MAKVNKPTDPELYARVKRKVKARVKRWPSAYASAQLVQEYQRAGGGYTVVNKPKAKSKKGTKRGRKKS
tara:strand:+ start:452 stop:658 length:207 start_codon:yes stop_codon:yes gene_type:complete